MLKDLVVQLLSHHKLDDIAEFSLDQILQYLDKFGYIKRDGKVELWEVENAIKLAQKFLGVAEEGLGPKTVKSLLTSVRCGCADLQNGAEANLGPGYWGPRDLTYAWDSYVDGLTKDQQHNLARKAFDDTESFCGLKFHKVDSTQNANLVISASNDKSQQLGSAGNVLAFQYLPPSPNFKDQLLAVFDLAETWVDNPIARGIYYRAVFAHEVTGHGIGLQHTSTPNQLLNPYYNVNISTAQNEDRKYITQLYGPPKGVTPNPVPTPTPTPTPTPSPTPIPVPTPSQIFNIKVDCAKNTISVDGYRVSKIGT